MIVHMCFSPLNALMGCLIRPKAQCLPTDACNFTCKSISSRYSKPPKLCMGRRMPKSHLVASPIIGTRAVKGVFPFGAPRPNPTHREWGWGDCIGDDDSG
jgi:hypothetical protein